MAAGSLVHFSDRFVPYRSGVTVPMTLLSQWFGHGAGRLSVGGDLNVYGCGSCLRCLRYKFWRHVVDEIFRAECGGIIAVRNFSHRGMIGLYCIRSVAKLPIDSEVPWSGGSFPYPDSFGMERS